MAPNSPKITQNYQKWPKSLESDKFGTWRGHIFQMHNGRTLDVSDFEKVTTSNFQHAVSKLWSNNSNMSPNLENAVVKLLPR